MACIKIIMGLIIATSSYPNSSYKTAKNICLWSEARKLDPYLVLALIRHESGFNYRLISRTGDYGLMQIHKKYSKAKCNLRKIDCNIKEGTRIMAIWRRVCLSVHNHKNSHWLRHYNWNSRKHHLRVLWIAKAYKSGSPKFIKLIKNRGYKKLRINYRCIKEGYCGASIN